MFAGGPVFGHGTGAIRGLFAKAAVGEDGARAQVVTNPHDQTLNVAVQWGVVGVIGGCSGCGRGGQCGSGGWGGQTGW